MQKNTYLLILSKKHSCFIEGKVMHILTSFFYFTTKFTPFFDWSLSKLPHFVINFSCISKKQLCVEKVLIIWMSVNVKMFVGMILNFCMVLFFQQVNNPYILNQCCNSVGTSLRFSFKRTLKTPDDKFILVKLQVNYIR